MSDEHSQRELSRRRFLAGAASQVAKHSLVTIPTVALILNGAAIPSHAANPYHSPGGPQGDPPRGPGNNRGRGND